MDLPYALPEPGPVVITSRGAVQGISREWQGHRSAAFLGIPYAQPPVGGLRFAAPEPPAPWEGVRDATRYGPTAQVAPLGEVTFIPEPTIPGDDVLTVNVFTPSLDGSAPVLVWFHGGGYLAGSPASPWYDGRAFCRDGVVVVTVGYRLGFEGFGFVEGTDVAPVNRAVLDWVAALKWVRDEIGAFGGDPSRVTIAGQSAGGGAVTTLLLTPAARGLYRGAIAQSGAFAPGPLAGAQRLTRRLTRSLGTDPSALPREELDAALRGLDASEDDPLARLRRVLTGVPSLAVGPVVDGELVPLPLDDAPLPDIPVLLGATAHEFTRQGPDVHAALAGLSPAEALERCGAAPDLAEQVLREHPDADAATAVGQADTEVTFRRPVAHLARLLAGRGYGYDLRRVVPASGFAEHCCELPFTWGLLDAEGVEDSYGRPLDQPGDIALAQQMHGAWVRFVQGGEPGWAAGSTIVLD